MVACLREPIKSGASVKWDFLSTRDDGEAPWLPEMAIIPTVMHHAIRVHSFNGLLLLVHLPPPTQAIIGRNHQACIGLSQGLIANTGQLLQVRSQI